MTPTNTLTFGVEIELLVKPKPALYEFITQYGYQESQEYYQLRKNRQAVFQAVARVLYQDGLETKTETDEHNGDFSTWTIAYDGSILESSPHDGFCKSILFLLVEGSVVLCSHFRYFANIALEDGVEVISKILASNDNWQSELGLVWHILKKNCDIRVHPSCGTHIHVSPGGHYTLDELKRISKTVVYYEPVITLIMPNDRKDCVWCRSNKQTCYQAIQIGWID